MSRSSATSRRCSSSCSGISRVIAVAAGPARRDRLRDRDQPVQPRRVHAAADLRARAPAGSASPSSSRSSRPSSIAPLGAAAGRCRPARHSRPSGSALALADRCCRSSSSSPGLAAQPGVPGEDALQPQRRHAGCSRNSWRCFLALSIYTASFIAEIVRAGILAVSHGQTEAARSLGSQARARRCGSSSCRRRCG